MAVIYLGELEDEQTGDDSAGIRKYSHFHYLNTAQNETAFDIFSHINTPQTGAVHRTDPAARCDGRSVVYVKRFRDGSSIKLRWKVKISYSTEIVIYENPLLEPAEVWWTGEQYQKPAELNRQGNPIVNKANTPVTGLTVEQTRPIANVRKNISPSGLGLISNGAAVDYVNDADFTIDNQTVGTNKGKYKFVGQSTTKYRNGVAYKVFDFQIHLREDQWKIHYPNQGLYQKNQDNPTGLPWPTFDNTGSQSTVPMPLNANGEQETSQNPADLITLDEDVYPELDFTAVLGPYWT